MHSCVGGGGQATSGVCRHGVLCVTQAGVGQQALRRMRHPRTERRQRGLVALRRMRAARCRRRRVALRRMRADLRLRRAEWRVGAKVCRRRRATAQRRLAGRDDGRLALRRERHALRLRNRATGQSAGEVVREGVGGRRLLVLKRGVLLHPHVHRAQMVLRCGHRRTVENGVGRNFDVGRQIGAQIKAIVAWLR